MALTAAQVAEQKKQVEELLGDVEQLGVAKGLFFGRLRNTGVFPYPALGAEEQQVSQVAAAKVARYAMDHIDAMKIDREANIPEEVIHGLGDLGVLGMTAPKSVGGLGFNQQQYRPIMEILGGHCASTAVFVNAHHSIGIRALLLFGTPEQQAQWLPQLVTGRKLAAFALTEPEAGSDAGNVQTTATPVENGEAFLLNGTKHYITNGGIADVLTVMARTPDGSGGSKVTAFLVTPDLPGFHVVEARAAKCGIRGTATGKMTFTNVRVPKSNILGPIGKGLRVALTVLDFGRTTFGASCTGHAKACLEAMTRHAKQRKQFQQSLSEFELVKKKIAFAAAHTYAMEATTRVCAALMDSGHDDFMLETAILKVFATEHLWTIVNDCIQIFGGKAYFADQPYERWMRDARINLIGEGANDVLKAFIAVVGCRGPGEYLKALRDDMLGGRWSLRRLMSAIGVGAKLIVPWASTPIVPVRTPALAGNANAFARSLKRFGLELPHVFWRLKDEARFVQAQLIHERIADIAIDLYVSACVLSRLDADKEALQPERLAGQYFLTMADRRMQQNFRSLTEHDDGLCVATADREIARW